MSPKNVSTSDDDNLRLRQLGYEPQLARRMGVFGNFAVSFSVISILTGILGQFGFGMTTGGPAVMMWGWIAVGGMVMFVGAGLAEVTSAYPTSGALYYMAHQLGGRKAGWYTGWLNLLGLVGAIAGIDYGASQFVGALLHLRFGFTPTPTSIMVIFVIIALLHAFLNSFGVRLVSLLNGVSVWWHLGGVAVIAAALAFIPSHHQPVSAVFGSFVNQTGWSNPIYVTLVGLLLAQYTFSGYDASAHLSEETTHAPVSAARGIVRSIWVSWIAGAVLLAAVLWGIQNYNAEVNTATGQPVAQIFIDAIGSGGATALLVVVVVAQLFCGNAAVAAASRMIFAFSRDGALPGSRQWRKVSASGTPVPAVWLAVGIALVLVVPSLFSSVAYGAVTSINVIGITPAYGLPILLRLRAGRRFARGPWHLGRWSVVVDVIAVVWVAFVTVLFCLPQRNPVNVASFNYAPIALAIVLALATIWWFMARRSYSTPEAVGAEKTALEDQVV